MTAGCEVGGYGGDEEGGGDVWGEDQGEVFRGVEEEEVETAVERVLGDGAEGGGLDFAEKVWDFHWVGVENVYGCVGDEVVLGECRHALSDGDEVEASEDEQGLSGDFRGDCDD